MVVIIMFIRKINVGELVQISPVDQTAVIRQYNCKVEKVNEGTVLIHSPYEQWNYVDLPTTELYWLNFTAGMFRYKAAINRLDAIDGLQVVEFRLIGEAESLQKRDHFRLACNIPIDFTLSEKDESGRWITGGTYSGNICNISGGGLKMTSGVELEEQNTILISLPLDNHNLLVAGIVRTKFSSYDAPNQFHYGIMFDNISNADQDIIVRYIFHQQNLRIRTTHKCAVGANMGCVMRKSG